MISTTELFGPSCPCATNTSADAKKIAMKRRLCMNIIVDVRGMNVNMRGSEDPIEGILRLTPKALSNASLGQGAPGVVKKI